MTDVELRAYAREQIADIIKSNRADVLNKVASPLTCDLTTATQLLALTKPDGTKLLGIVSDEYFIPDKATAWDMLNAGFVRLVKDE